MGTSTLLPKDSFSPILVREFASPSASSANLTLVYDLVKRFAGLTPDEVVQEVVTSVSLEVQCDSCCVYLLEGEDFVLRASKNSLAATLDRVPRKQTQDIAFEALVISQDASESNAFTLFNRPSEVSVESFLSIPIISDGRIIGFINLHSGNAQRYSDREIAFISILGLMMMTEIERKRLKVENAMLLGKLESRRVVEKAKGILQRDLDISEEAAYRVLQRESQERRRSMKDIAEAVILSDSLKASPTVRRISVRESRGTESAR